MALRNGISMMKTLVPRIRRYWSWLISFLQVVGMPILRTNRPMSIGYLSLIDYFVHAFFCRSGNAASCFRAGCISFLRKVDVRACSVFDRVSSEHLHKSPAPYLMCYRTFLLIPLCQMGIRVLRANKWFAYRRHIDLEDLQRGRTFPQSRLCASFGSYDSAGLWLPIGNSQEHTDHHCLSGLMFDQRDDPLCLQENSKSQHAISRKWLFHVRHIFHTLHFFYHNNGKALLSMFHKGNAPIYSYEGIQ